MPSSVAEFHAQRDPRLQATVTDGWPLLYAQGPDPTLDRPGHVRAGSGLVRLGDRLAVVQDDAHFLALVDPLAQSVHAVTLPAGPGGLRQFDTGRGNKRHKLDLEAALALGRPDGGWDVLALGSGSTLARQRVVRVADAAGQPQVAVLDAHDLYLRLRQEEGFAGSELNVEGAAVLDRRLWLLQRGNGAVCGDQQPCDALAWVDLAEFRAFVDQRGPCPQVHVQGRWILGDLNGVRLTFTDAAPSRDGRLWFLAAAEASPDTYQDGEVVGAALGWLDPASGSGAWAPLQRADGTPFVAKAEGLAVDEQGAWIVLDPDDATRPSELWRVQLSGPWPA